MNNLPHNSLQDSQKKPAIITAAAATVIFLALAGYSARGLRGSDQYWYVSDVQTMIDGQEKVTNTIYPVHFQKTGSFEKPGFIHNILPLYLVLPAAKVFGAYYGWIVTNIIASVLTAIMIGWIILKRSDIWAAAAGYSIFLLMPLNIWLVAQPLAEPITTLLATATMLFYIRARETNKFQLWFLCTISACLGYWCRFTLLPISMLVPLAYFLVNFRKKFSITGTLILVTTILAMLALQPKLFPESAPISFISVLNNAIGKDANMDTYYIIKDAGLSPGILNKIGHGLTLQFIPDIKQQIFYLPFNILAMISVMYILKSRDRLKSPVKQCIALFLLIHLATITLCQNQFRYLLVSLPVIIAGSALFLTKLNLIIKHRRAFLIFIAVILIIADLPISNHLNNDSAERKTIHKELSAIFRPDIQQDDPVILETVNNESMLIGYILKPNPVYVLKKDKTNTAAEYLNDRLDARWLICSPTSDVLSIFEGHKPELINEIPILGIYFGFYRLNSPNEK